MLIGYFSHTRDTLCLSAAELGMRTVSLHWQQCWSVSPLLAGQPLRTISSLGWIPMKLCPDVHVSQRTSPTDIAYLFTILLQHCQHINHFMLSMKCHFNSSTDGPEIWWVDATDRLLNLVSFPLAPPWGSNFRVLSKSALDAIKLDPPSEGTETLVKPWLFCSAIIRTKSHFLTRFAWTITLIAFPAASAASYFVFSTNYCSTIKQAYTNT